LAKRSHAWKLCQIIALDEKAKRSAEHPFESPDFTDLLQGGVALVDLPCGEFQGDRLEPNSTGRQVPLGGEKTAFGLVATHSILTGSFDLSVELLPDPPVSMP